RSSLVTQAQRQVAWIARESDEWNLPAVLSEVYAIPRETQLIAASSLSREGGIRTALARLMQVSEAALDAGHDAHWPHRWMCTEARNPWMLKRSERTTGVLSWA